MGNGESALEKEYQKKYEGVDIDGLPDRIADTFKGKTLFITGGTGFMGKVLVEKILRDCPDLKKMYLLTRVKKGMDPKERLYKIFQSPLFDKVKEIHGEDVIKNKVAYIGGDVTVPELGMSESDRQILIDEVDIVYHLAATIRFDETLKRAVLLNVRGTKMVLELAKQMKHIEFFYHMSTAYCHLEEKILEERSYPPLCNPHDLIKSMEWMEDDVAETLTQKILGKYPNTYAFTKNLAEAIVVEAIESDPPFPAVIARPSIVVPIWREPLPGWTDNINGPTGLLIGAGKGVIRTMYCKQEGHADYLPVDIAVNAVLVVTWNFVTNKDYSRRYFHFTSSEEIRISWEELILMGRKITEEIPLNGVVWYPGGSMKKSKLLHTICVILFHYIPAYFIDTLLFFLGYKPIMCRVQSRISKGFEVFEYYANNQWQFMNTHVYYARSVMNPKERERYKVDGLGLDIEQYFKSCILAARAYILNEAPETLPAARRHLKIMYWVDVITKIALTLFFFYLMSRYFEFFHFIFFGLLSVFQYVLNIFTPKASAQMKADA
ncbi:hypothetical protein RUM43_001220 [Polyplax serrata]|uniref:Fatty acyl-CoA reductase n=1 Tax=Polyplax serrata TaxID=468196 RepID=A0AAN8SF04_POLSC